MSNIGSDGPVRIAAAEWQAKYKSKKEQFECKCGTRLPNMSSVLSVSVCAYLSSYDTVTVYFLKDLIMGKKSFIKCNQVKVMFCPQYESLSIERILERAREWKAIWNYLPDDRDLHRLPRQWVINVIYTVVGDSFQDWVNERIEQRNSKVAEDDNKMIEVDPEIAAAFNASNYISGKYMHE